MQIKPETSDEYLDEKNTIITKASDEFKQAVVTAQAHIIDSVPRQHIRKLWAMLFDSAIGWDKHANNVNNMWYNLAKQRQQQKKLEEFNKKVIKHDREITREQLEPIVTAGNTETNTEIGNNKI